MEEDYSLPPTIGKPLWERLNEIAQKHHVRRAYVLRRGLELFDQLKEDRGPSGRQCVVPGLGKVSDAEARRIVSIVSRHFSRKWAARHKDHVRRAGAAGRVTRYGKPEQRE